MRRPLRRQIMLPFLAVALASVAIVGGVNAWLAARQTRQEVDRKLRNVVGVLASSNFPLSGNVLRQMRDLCGAEFALADRGGRWRTSSRSIEAQELPREVAVAASAADVELGLPQSIDGRPYFHSAVRLIREGGAEDVGVLHILFPRDAYLRAWRQAFVPPLVVGMAAAVAAGGVARVVASRVTGATVALGAEVERLARGDYSPLQLSERDDELRDLEVAVNRTAAMLAQYERQVRRSERIQTVALLGAGLAHELRNSVTGCRLALDLHGESCASRAASDDESLDVARRQLRLMENLLQRFLRLGQPTPGRTPQILDFAELVADLLSLVEPAARHARVVLRWRPPLSAAPVLAESAELSQAVLNLLLNAIEAAQKDSTPTHTAEVCVEVTAGADESATLTVADTGAGPSDAVAQSLFEPFVTTKPEGVGLGLAMTRQVVESMSGEVSWERTVNRTSFRVRLPLAKPR